MRIGVRMRVGERDGDFAGIDPFHHGPHCGNVETRLAYLPSLA
jgi:hypothetical protein